MRKNRKLNNFECEQIVSLKLAERTHEAFARILKFSKSTVTDVIVRYANSNNGSNAKRFG